jgi:hypothetical protein
MAARATLLKSVREEEPEKLDFGIEGPETGRSSRRRFPSSYLNISTLTDDDQLTPNWLFVD